MSDLRTLLDRAIGPYDPSLERALDLTVRRAAQRQRRRRVGAAVVGLAASLVALGFAIWAFAGSDESRPAGAERGRFMLIGGDMLGRAENRLYTMDGDGGDLRAIPSGDLYLFAAAPSPDGERVALMASQPWPKGEMPNIQLFLMGSDGSDLREIPACPEDGCQGTIEVSWSPDGRSLSFPGNGIGINVLDIRTGATRRLTGGSNLDDDAAWSPDGRMIAFSRTEPSLDPDENAQIWVMRADGTGAHQVTEEAFAHDASQPAWSPDGTTIAYTEGGRPGGTAGIAVIDVDGSTARQLTACTFGTCDRFPTNPAWSPDGSAIAVLWHEARLTRAAVALVDPETGDLRVVRELQFAALSLSWQAGTP
jgi:Tol biopolymer transport system component